MAGYGFVGAGGAAGMTDALKEIVAQRLLEKKLEEQRMQQEFENRMATRAADTGDARFDRTQGHTETMDTAGLGLRTRSVELDARGLGHRISQDVRGNTIEDKDRATAAQKELGRVTFLRRRGKETGSPAFEGLEFGLNPEVTLTGEERGKETGEEGLAAWQSGGSTVNQGRVNQQTAGNNASARFAASLRPAPSQKPPTQAEKAILAFYHTAQQSSDDADVFEPSVSGMEARLLPSWLQTKEGQQYSQAQKAFTEARLRKVSGAAISQQEYANDAAMYFAQPNDSPEVLAQKKRGRQNVLEGLAYGSGNAFADFYGGAFDRGKFASGKPDSGPVTVTINGKTYRFDDQAKADAFKAQAGGR